MTAVLPQRLVALDVFRGATVAAMILVNNPGSWAAIYAPLRHAAWHGWTPTDLIFPFFLFIVGVSIAIAIGRRLAAGVPRGELVRKIVLRGAVIVAIGLLLHAYPRIVPRALLGLVGLDSLELGTELGTLRLPGVLQRIGLCYTAAALLFVFVKPRLLTIVTVLLLAGYHALLTLVPVPGVGAPDLDGRGTHLAGWIDRTVLGEAHLWSQAKVYDPEGLLSTLPAIATVLLGVAAGLVIRRERPLEQRVLTLFVHGTALAAIGHLYGFWLPINKPLWTSSYALLTAGLAGAALAWCLYACDLRGWRRLVEPLRIYGVNAIFVFAGSALLVKTLVLDPRRRRGWRARAAPHLDPPRRFRVLARWRGGLARVRSELGARVLGWMDRRGLHLKI